MFRTPTSRAAPSDRVPAAHSPLEEPGLPLVPLKVCRRDVRASSVPFGASHRLVRTQVEARATTTATRRPSERTSGLASSRLCGNEGTALPLLGLSRTSAETCNELHRSRQARKPSLLVLGNGEPGDPAAFVTANRSGILATPSPPGTAAAGASSRSSRTRATPSSSTRSGRSSRSLLRRPLPQAWPPSSPGRARRGALQRPERRPPRPGGARRDDDQRGGLAARPPRPPRTALVDRRRLWSRRRDLRGGRESGL